MSVSRFRSVECGSKNPTMTDIRFIYVTAASEDEAETIALKVVEERLAACANVLGPTRSFYYWQGKLERGNEFTLLLKSTQSLENRLISRIRELHSYECPAIIVLPVLGGNDAFLDWVRAETKPQS